MSLRLVPSLGHVFLSYPAPKSLFPISTFAWTTYPLVCVCVEGSLADTFEQSHLFLLFHMCLGSCWLLEWGVTKRFVLFCLLIAGSWSSDPLTGFSGVSAVNVQTLLVPGLFANSTSQASFPFLHHYEFHQWCPLFSILYKVSLGGDEFWLVQEYLCQFCKFVFIIFVDCIQCQELYKSWLIWSQQSHELHMPSIFRLQMRQGQEQATYPTYTVSPGESAFLSTWADFRVFTWLCWST